MAWETMDDPDPHMRDYAEIWRAAEKIVYSSTLEQVSSARTRIERRFDPEAVRELKRTAARDLAIGGPRLAAEAFAAGLVDRVHLLLSPVIVGGGKPALPDGVRLDLELVDERRFGNGVVHLAYRARRPSVVAVDHPHVEREHRRAGDARRRGSRARSRPSRGPAGQRAQRLHHVGDGVQRRRDLHRPREHVARHEVRRQEQQREEHEPAGVRRRRAARLERDRAA